MPWETGAQRSRVQRPAPRASRLQVVPRVQRARGSHFVLLVAGMLVTGLIGLLLLNLSMQKGAFELAGLQEQTSVLRTSEQALAFELERSQSTEQLVLRAKAEGMVPNANPVFLDLSDGTILGTPVPAQPRYVPPAPQEQSEAPLAPEPRERAAAGVRERVPGGAGGDR